MLSSGLRAVFVYQVLVTLGIAPAWSQVAIPQEPSEFRQRQVDQVDIDEGGSPLAPPAGSKLTKPPGNQNVTTLCEKLKSAGQVPEYCK
jgi:hypothetical protein